MLHEGKLTEKDRERLVQNQSKNGKSFLEALYEEKLLDEHEILGFLSEVSNLPILRLDAYKIEKAVLQTLSEKIAQQYGVVPIAKIGPVLTLATSKPLDLIALDDLKEITRCEIRCVLATPGEIQNILSPRSFSSKIPQLFSAFAALTRIGDINDV